MAPAVPPAPPTSQQPLLAGCPVERAVAETA
jgi:hypothetical protein